MAYVIDPIQNLRGFFQWKNGKIEKLKGYYIYDDVGKPIKIEQTRAKKEDASSHKGFKASAILLALLLAVTVFLAFYAVSLNNQYKRQLEEQEKLLASITSQQMQIQNQKSEIEGQKAEIGKQQETINDQQAELESQNVLIQNQNDTIVQLQELLENGILGSTGQTTAAGLIEMLQSSEISLPNQEALIHELQELLESVPEGAVVIFKPYTVMQGDTLFGICKAHELTYSAVCNIILAINGIQNAGQIDVGQIILLPAIYGE